MVFWEVTNVYSLCHRLTINVKNKQIFVSQVISSLKISPSCDKIFHQAAVFSSFFPTIFIFWSQFYNANCFLDKCYFSILHNKVTSFRISVETVIKESLWISFEVSNSHFINYHFSLLQHRFFYIMS